MLGFPPVMWFNDSYSYVFDAVHRLASQERPSGYPVLLALLMPLHSFTAVAAVQHLMGLGLGVASYALLRHRGLPGWAAMLAAVPVLFDAYQVQLEQQVMSDTLFMAAVMGAVVLACWTDRISMPAAITAGLLTGYAMLVRSAGLPLLLVVVACLRGEGNATDVRLGLAVDEVIGTYSTSEPLLKDEAPRDVPHCAGMLRHGDRLALALDLKRLLETFPVGVI